MIEVWKAVSRDRVGYRSHGNFESWASLPYKIGVVTKPRIPNSALFAFDTYENARAFGICSPILKCEAEEHAWNGTLGWIPMILSYSKEVPITMFWSQLRAPWIQAHRRWPLPEGTVLCKWIKVLARV